MNPSNQPETKQNSPIKERVSPQTDRQHTVPEDSSIPDAQGEVGLRELVIQLMDEYAIALTPQSYRLQEIKADEIMALFQADKSAAVVEAENAARLAEQANTRADTNGNLWYRTDIDTGKEVTQLERIDELLALLDPSYATFLARLQPPTAGEGEGESV
jgi:hypothetical protein